MNDISAVVLKRYLEIRNGHSLPYFALLKKIKCKRCTGLEEMWKEHARAMEDFREEKKNNFQNIETKPDAVYSLLDLKYDIAKELLKGCVFCERRCRANRAEGKLGWCRVGAEARVATMFEHWGEERVLVPSGTIFFSGCTWRCVYCMDGATALPVISDGKIKIICAKEFDEFFDQEDEGVVDVSNRNLYAIGPEGKRKITHILRRHSSDSKMFELVTTKGRRILLSGEHRILTNNSNKVEEKRVDRLRIGDAILTTVVLPLRHSTSCLNLIEEFVSKTPPDLLRNIYVRGVHKSLKNYVSHKNSSFAQLSRDAGIKHEPHRYKRGAMPILDFHKIVKIIDPKEDDLKGIKIGVAGSEHPLPAILPLTPELMRLSGYFVAEGNYRDSGHNRDLVITMKDAAIRKDIKKCLRVLNTYTYESNILNKATQIFFGGTLGFILFRYVLGIPKGAQNKKFPDLIFNVDNNLRKEFLSAYITGDGTLAYRPAKSCCFVRVVTTSNMIKTQMAYLLSSEGIKFSIHKHICTSVLPTGYRSKLLQWWIAFGGKKNIQKFVQVASFLDPRMNRLYNFLKRTKELRKKEEYEAIRELRQVRPTRNFVYDIVLEGGDNDWRKHSFYAGDGILIHNCQNWDISQFPERGAIMSGKEIASWIDEEAEEGRVINANFVGGEPTPNLHTIIDTARHTKSPTPIIWNSNMYMSEETNDLLEGVVDLYLADFRYGNDECAMRLSSVPNYMATMKRNFKRTSRDAEMIVRILVLPNHIECCARNILKWIGENIADRVYVNLMSQYRPEYKAMEYPEIARRLYSEEYRRAVKYLKETGIKYFEIQGGI